LQLPTVSGRHFDRVPPVSRIHSMTRQHLLSSNSAETQAGSNPQSGITDMAALLHDPRQVQLVRDRLGDGSK
jgi:hypothetical protein